MTKLTVKYLKKAEQELRSAQVLSAFLPRSADHVCFHSQVAIENYLRALLQKLGQPIDRSFDTRKLLHRLIALDYSLKTLSRSSHTHRIDALEYLYPGIRMTSRHARAYLKKAERFRTEIRRRLEEPRQRAE